VFLIDKESELTPLLLGQIINKFQTQDLIKLTNYWNYYKGNHKIMRKVATDVGKPCNRVMTNYCYNIVQNYKGYLTGIPIGYSSDVEFDGIQEILNYNDVHSVDAEMLKNALVFGVAYEIAYLDELGQ
jgi:SPP1 family phage portal protein